MSAVWLHSCGAINPGLVVVDPFGSLARTPEGSSAICSCRREAAWLDVTPFELVSFSEPLARHALRVLVDMKRSSGEIDESEDLLERLNESAPLTDAKACLCMPLLGCSEDYPGCEYCAYKDPYLQCPVTGFGCGEGGCDCCSTEQKLAADAPGLSNWLRAVREVTR